MNQSIVRLFAFVILLFTLLVVWTTRWTVLSATALQNDPLNKLTFFAALKIERGRILADNGAVLARSVPAGGGTWTRRYPTGSLFAQPIGYSIASLSSSAGLERYRSAELKGTSTTGLSSVFGPLGGNRRVGNDVYTTLDPKAQALARTLLAGRIGSVVALDPRTGGIKVLYANPSYDDNAPTSTAGGASQYDRAVQGQYPPGSTFKVVTATAALDSGRYTPTSPLIDGKSPITVSGVPLQNDNNDQYGLVPLTTALTNSINTVFAQVGEALGLPTMAGYMKRFGFYQPPPLDLPSGEMTASGERASPSKLYSPTSGSIDLGRMAIGQDKLTVTPLQMAMVVAAVANGGKLMRPHITARIVNPDGQTVESFPPTVYRQVMKASTAAELTQMMRNVVEEGTGTSANLLGLPIAGKTGTAQVAGNVDDPWFIGFGPVGNPRVAVAVTLEKIPLGYGGTYAAPIAAQIIKLLVAEGQ